VDYLRIRNNYIVFDSGSPIHLVYKALVAYAIKHYHDNKKGKKVLETEKVIKEGIIDVFDTERKIAFEIQTILDKRVEEDKSKYPFEVRIIKINPKIKELVHKLYAEIYTEVARLP
jgi:hypothetical protein